MRDLGWRPARFREDVGSSAADTERTSSGALSPTGDLSGPNVEDPFGELGLKGGKKFGGGGATYRG